MVVGCWGPHQQGHTSSSDYVTPVTAAPVRGCTPDCLRKPAAGSHPSSGRGIPVSLPLPQARAYARGLQGYRRTHPPPAPPPRQPSRARSLSYRPSCRSCRPPKPTSLAADQPLRQRRLRQPLPPAGELRTRSTTAAATPASFSRRPSYAATAITFAGKSSEAVREPGLTLQGVVRGHGKPFFLVFYFFFSLILLSLSFSREKRDSFAQSIK